MVEVLDQDNLQEVLNENEKVVVHFYASWCANCKLMMPKFKKLANENDGTTFVVVDADKHPNSRRMAKVENLPTFATYKNGTLVKQIQTNKFEILRDLVEEVVDN